MHLLLATREMNGPEANPSSRKHETFAFAAKCSLVWPSLTEDCKQIDRLQSLTHSMKTGSDIFQKSMKNKF